MKAGERTRLVAAIKQGTDSLFKAGTAPEHAAHTATVRSVSSHCCAALHEPGLTVKMQRWCAGVQVCNAFVTTSSPPSLA